MLTLINPAERAEPFDHPDWLFEPNFDGFRVAADSVHGRFAVAQPDAAVRSPIGSVSTRSASQLPNKRGVDAKDGRHDPIAWHHKCAAQGTTRG
jgi:hypothetical protein